ncbi:MAG: trypsin-like peptidase domain-containing protein, partial [Phaeodactylibacter sp.]|nr:trypsin-like peptidase domain-containing protein [Phaeodactylibacter sp.]
QVLRDANTSSLSGVSTIVLPALDNEALLQEEMDNRGPNRAPRFAQRQEVDLRPSSAGSWENLAGGLQRWRVRIQSPGAHSLNLGFTEYYMPPGGELRIYDPAQSDVLGPFTPSDNEGHQQLWTPVLGGDEIVLEVTLPAVERPNLRLRLTSVNHDFLNFYGVTTGACHLDVLCDESDGWGIVDLYRDIIQSVAVYGTGGETFCTGALINNTANDCRPYFLTAYHCDITPSTAPSVVVYWNFQNSFCRQPGTVASGNPGNGTLSNFNTGSNYRAGFQSTDFLLLELDDPVPAAAQAYFAGWSREATTPQDTVICIHHPDGAEKRISFSFMDTYPGGWGNGNQEVPDGNHLIVPDWTIGSTEIGSSGAPLLNKQGRIVGQLHGGGASCSNNEYDAFGWIRASWEGGGTPTSRLKDWLAPNGENQVFLDGRWLSSCNASIHITPTVPAICIPGTADFEIEIAEAFSGLVDIEVNGLPDGVNYSIDPGFIYGGSTVTLTIDAFGSDLSSGTLSFSVTATGEFNTITASTSI